MSSRVLLALCAVAGASAAICDGSVSDPALSAMLGSIAGTGTLNGATVSIGDGAIRYPDDSSFFCVYDVVVEFATKNAYVKMGPAGAPLSPSNYECWKMVVDSGTVTLDRYRGATTCKPSGVSGLTAFDSTPISSFGMNSTTSNKVECSSAIDLSAVASSSLGTDSTFNAVDINNRTGTVMYSKPTGWNRLGLSNFECVTSLSPTTDSSYKLTTTSACLYVKPAYIAGAASVVFEASSTCSYATYALASAALSATEQSWSLKYLSPPSSTTSVPTVTAPKVALKTENKAALSFSFSLTGNCLDSLDKSLNPCSIAAIRSAYADALGIPLGNMVLQGLTVGGKTYTLLSSSSGNLATGLCSVVATDASCAARRELAGRELAAATISYSAAAVQPAGSTLTAATVTSANPSMASVAAAMGVPAPTATAPTGVTASTVAVTFQTTVARVNPYTPHELIKLYHAMPRFGGVTNNFTIPANFGFSTDALLKQKESYLGGVVIPGLALIVIGFVVGFLYIFAYCCGCCRCCRGQKCKRDPDTYYKGIRRYVGPALAMGILAVINFALIISVIVYTPKFGLGISAFGVALNDFLALLTSAVAILGNSAASTKFTYTKVDGTSVEILPMYGGLDLAATGAASASTMSQGGTPAVSMIQTLLSTVSAGLSSALTAVDQASSPLAGAKSSVDGAIPNDLLKQVSSIVGMAALGVFAVIAGIIFLQSSMVCRNRCACCMFKSFSLPAVILTILLFILAGIFNIIGMIGADVCYDPNTMLSNLIASGSDMGSQTLYYYLNCATTPMDPQGALTTIASATSLIATAASQTTNLQDQFYTAARSGGSALTAYGSLLTDDITITHPYFDSTDAIGKMAMGVNNATSSLNILITDTLSCAALDKIFSKFWDGLCNGTIASAIGIARILIAAGVLLLIQLAIGIDLCCYHPGDPHSWTKGGAVSTTTPASQETGEDKEGSSV